MDSEPEVDPPLAEAPLSADPFAPEIEDYRQRINASCRMTTTHLFELAAVCREAADSLSTAQVQELLKSKLLIDRSTFWKYVKIGRDSRLQGISDKLPPSLSIAYEVAQLKDDQLRKAVDTNAIHPNARRSVIVALRKQSPNRREETPNQTQTPKRPATKIEAGRRYRLNIPGDAKDDICEQIAWVLDDLREKWGLEITPIEESGAVPAQAPSLSSPVNHHFSGLSERLRSSTSLTSAAENEGAEVAGAE
jgi:hypothetical protein